AVGGTVRAGRKIEIDPAAGKKIASIQSVTLSASTGTAGAFGVVCEIDTPIVIGVAGGNSTNEYEAIMREIGSQSSCLALNVFCTTTRTGNIEGGITFAQK
ncbi:MAG: hypothetical protein ACRDAM_01270, partial [Casimicrobium sp.]